MQLRLGSAVGNMSLCQPNDKVGQCINLTKVACYLEMQYMYICVQVFKAVILILLKLDIA